MKTRRTALPLALFLVLSLGSAPLGASEVDWDARAAEHLLNRAGFGASPEEIRVAVERGLEATVDRLLRTGEARATEASGPREVRAGVHVPRALTDGPPVDAAPPLAMTREFYLDRGVREALGTVRNYCADWIGSMLAGATPLRDRMAIFWHGHFVSEFKVVTDADDMVRQVDFLRREGLGDFETLVRGIARDPAMLVYLNNNLNVKSHPNENWARELMELFTLGEGNYTEDDIKETARAYTGWTNHGHDFVFERDQHDYGPKLVLGVRGNLDGDDVIDILLEREDCARFLAWKLIGYFEGVEPGEARVEEYAAHLREADYHVGTFLRRLFTDPAFYREEVRATRVAAPVEYFVGMARRSGIAPPRNMIFVTASLLGQHLFDPPNVKGWEEGMAWMTTGSVMQRSNLVGALFGIVGAENQSPPKEIFDAKVALLGREFNGPYVDYLSMLAWYRATQWEPGEMGFLEGLRGVENPSDAVVVESLLEHLLAVPPTDASRERITRELAEWRAAANLPTDSLLAPEGHDLLVRLAHLILSLPEAQLT